MYCPRCGDPLQPSGATLKCTRGDMELSQNLRSQLAEVFVARSRNGRSLPLNWGGSWYCPGCGTPATTETKHVRCTRCGELLDEFLYALVELHPHR